MKFEIVIRKPNTAPDKCLLIKDTFEADTVEQAAHLALSKVSKDEKHVVITSGHYLEEVKR